MLRCKYNATVCPEWEVDGEAIMSVDTLLVSAVPIPEILINTLFAGSGTVYGGRFLSFEVEYFDNH